MTADPTAIRPKIPRARSVRNATPFRMATLLWGFHGVGLVVSIVALAMIFQHPVALMMWIAVGGLIFSGLVWLISFFKRRSARCPLCKGTPLLNSGAIPHLRARRIGILNHGVSAMLSIMTHQQFRCMYCGSDYDLLKPWSRADKK